MSEQIGMHPDDYKCEEVCPWFENCIDKIINKISDFMTWDDAEPVYVTPQGYENENGDPAQIPIRTRRKKRRRPSRKRMSFIRYATPQYPSSSSSSNEEEDSLLRSTILDPLNKFLGTEEKKESNPESDSKSNTSIDSDESFDTDEGYAII